MSRVVLQSKKSSEMRYYEFDFISQLAPGDSFTASAVTASLLSGTDANPSAILFEAPLTDGRIVKQKIMAGVPGNLYLIKATGNGLLGTFYTIEGILAILP